MKTWYSVFVSPTNNIHYFTLELPDQLEANKTNQATMTLLADRSHHARGPHDGGLLSVNYRVNVESHWSAEPDEKGEPKVSFLAVLAKDAKDPSDGLNVMILKRVGETLEGIFSWNSLTSGTIKSAPITWTRNQSESHRRMMQP